MGSGAESVITARQQGAAPDRLQLRSFLATLPAAGELGRCAAALTESCRKLEYSGRRKVLRWMRVLASRFLRLEVTGSGAAFWVSGGAAVPLCRGFWSFGRAAFRLVRGFWSSAADTFRLVSKYFVSAAGGDSNASTAAQQGAAPDRLQPALRSSLRLPAAGELGRCAVAQNLAACYTLIQNNFKGNFDGKPKNV